MKIKKNECDVGPGERWKVVYVWNDRAEGECKRIINEYAPSIGGGVMEVIKEGSLWDEFPTCALMVGPHMVWSMSPSDVARLHRIPIQNRRRGCCRIENVGSTRYSTQIHWTLETRNVSKRRMRHQHFNIGIGPSRSGHPNLSYFNGENATN